MEERMKRASVFSSLALLLLAVLLGACGGEKKVVIDNQKSKDSYSLGWEFGESLKNRDVEIDKEALFLAVRDALDGRNPAISSEDVRNNLQDMKKRTAAQQEKRAKEAAAKNLEAGKTFLVSNKGNSEIKTLPSGLQYKELKEGNGPSPKTTDKVSIHYRGTLIDGTEFDSTYTQRKPETVRVNAVIPGWTEALQLMKAGSKWQIFVPAELAYGSRKMGRIPANSTLIFEIELLSIVPKATPAEIEESEAAAVKE
jgi:FKBP-type peptidyl-prolyl cis-trans isomerase FklB